MYTLVDPQPDEQEAGAGTDALSRLLLDQFSQAVFALDANGIIVEPVSASMPNLFRREDCRGLRLMELLRPLVPRKFIRLTEAYLAALHDRDKPGSTVPDNPLLDIEVRFEADDGRHELLHYMFEFTPMQIEGQDGTLLVRVTDTTTAQVQARELEDLRLQLRTQSDILQTLLRIGTPGFATAMRTTGGMLESINTILRRPAREDAAFRTKLEQTLSAADRIGRVLAGTSLGALTQAAQRFETALMNLRDAPALSGNDFLPLAVLLDELSLQFSQVRALVRTLDAAPGHSTEGDAEGSRGASYATSALTASPRLVMQLLEPETGHDTAGDAQGTSGSLAHTFVRLTEQVAGERGLAVNLACTGLERIPREYAATVKNIVIQLIRNAVMHAIEPRAERVRSGKGAVGQLRVDFRTASDGGFELCFEDDGRGIDPESVREVAISRALITPGAAISLDDRQALKVIFKAKYSTLPDIPGKPRHGVGLAFVRRYVHDAGGVISVGSEPGRSTRFKVHLPAVGAAATKAAES